MDNNAERLKSLVEKMGIQIADTDILKKENMSYSKMLDISKPNRPKVKKYFQKQLESIARDSKE